MMDAKIKALRVAQERVQELQDAVAESKKRTRDLEERWHEAVGDFDKCRRDILEEAVPGSCTIRIALPA